MSFQAYLDNVEEKTGKTPKQFIAEAKKKKLTLGNISIERMLTSNH